MRNENWIQLIGHRIYYVILADSYFFGYSLSLWINRTTTVSVHSQFTCAHPRGSSIAMHAMPPNVMWHDEKRKLDLWVFGRHVSINVYTIRIWKSSRPIFQSSRTPKYIIIKLILMCVTLCVVRVYCRHVFYSALLLWLRYQFLHPIFLLFSFFCILLLYSQWVKKKKNIKSFYIIHYIVVIHLKIQKTVD